MSTTRSARRGRRWFCLTVLLPFTVLLSGCGGGPYPVEGKVVWKDGAPATELKGAQVIFDLPEKQTSARGSVEADGTFRLTTNKPNDGALPGEYKVLILEIGRKPAGGPDGSALAPGVIDSRYADPSTTDLNATVTSGTNHITLTVDRAKR